MVSSWSKGHSRHFTGHSQQACSAKAAAQQVLLHLLLLPRGCDQPCCVHMGSAPQACQRTREALSSSYAMGTLPARSDPSTCRNNGVLCDANSWASRSWAPAVEARR